MTRRRSILLFVAVLPLMGVLFPVKEIVHSATEVRMVRLSRGAHGSLPPEVEFVGLLALQIVAGYAVLIAAIVLILRSLPRSVVSLGCGLRPVAQGAAVGAVVGVAIAAVSIWLHAIPTGLLYRGFVGMPNRWALPIVTLCATLGSMGEELYFRGLLLGLSREFMRRRPAAVLNVCLFMAWHTWAYHSVTQLAGVAAIGIACVSLTERFGGITPAIACHVVVNAVSYNLQNLIAA